MRTHRIRYLLISDIRYLAQLHAYRLEELGST